MYVQKYNYVYKGIHEERGIHEYKNRILLKQRFSVEL